jgi:DNA-directed RNA polymerase subunit RPC12/RpoP
MSFEVLKEPEPADAGEGTGGYLWVDLETPALNRAFLSRSVRAQRFFGIWYFLSDPASGQRQAEDIKHFPTGATKGRLRLVRNGAVVSYHTAEESSDKFVFLFEHPFGKEDVKTVRIGGLTGGAKASLDFRIADLRIRAQSFVDLPDPALAQAGSGAGNGWVFAGLIIGAVLAGSLTLAVWRSVRQRGGERNRLAAARTKKDQAQPEGASAPAIFLCSGCGKRLKVRTALTGKRVQCPYCQQVVLVPNPSASQA